MSFYNTLIHIHSGFRWLVLLFIIVVIIMAIINLNKKSGGKSGRNLPGLLALIFTHLQLVTGFILYFISPKVIFDASSMKNSMLRFFLVEHIALMLIAILLITIGYVKYKRISDAARRNKNLVVYYTIALVLILVSIPWPFRNLGAGWF